MNLRDTPMSERLPPLPYDDLPYLSHTLLIQHLCKGGLFIYAPIPLGQRLLYYPEEITYDALLYVLWHENNQGRTWCDHSPIQADLF